MGNPIIPAIYYDSIYIVIVSLFTVVALNGFNVNLRKKNDWSFAVFACVVFVLFLGTRPIDDYFADTITNVGLKGEQAQNQLATQNKIMGDLRDLRDSISGVNIDEELADIIKFQHGYNVAAKFISVQDELLDTLINRLGV